MEKIGCTIHRIRIEKGLTQKEVYGKIVSRSFASCFEKGANDIGASKLFLILDNLAISADELRYIQQNYQPSPLEQALLTVMKAYAAQNFPAISQWIQEHSHSPHAYDKLVSSYASILLLAYDHSSIGITTTTRPIYLHLQQAKMWTIQELKLVNILVPIVATTKGLSALHPLTERMAANCLHYQTKWGDPFNVLNNLVEFYGTLLQTYLNFHDYQAARQLKSKITALNSHNLNWDGRLAQQFWIGIWELYFGDWTLGNELLDEVTALEKRHKPRIDNTLFAIRKLRTQAAKTYRQ
ncbi:helix-turn-helix transcriptional regulator [Pediococcus ethanolidurans]|uniref:helix-turn-helix domain-containing protein n=1 Tax=Pediococcus ethanolidurans TaxID=319653 RepID=UPI001C1F0DBF|nr:helix-turn-helix transcriptional regulator [Pediococcus ethanolidurans]MBU7563876.1 helix-turn-helix transcriptional regulator [Pediococcus ethanolidurans]